MSDHKINRRVHPNCCDEMRRRQTISLALPDYQKLSISFYTGDHSAIDSFYEESDKDAKPTWEIRGYRPAHIDFIKKESHVITEDGHKVDTTTFEDPPEADWPEIGPDDFMNSWGFEPKFCPFCGEGMPEIVLRFDPPKKIATCSDGGYYCDTCSQRLNECQCYPPQWKWAPYCYNPKFGDERVCMCGHTYYRHFDSFEDMKAVGCKYCGDCRMFKEEE